MYGSGCKVFLWINTRSATIPGVTVANSRSSDGSVVVDTAGSRARSASIASQMDGTSPCDGVAGTEDSPRFDCCPIGALLVYGRLAASCRDGGGGSGGTGGGGGTMVSSSCFVDGYGRLERFCAECGHSLVTYSFWRIRTDVVQLSHHVPIATAATDSRVEVLLWE